MDGADERLNDVIGPAVEAAGYELVGIEHVSGQGGVLRVYIDGPAGIGVDDCERASRQISGVLDVEDPIQGHYVLEVSSPGLDRPLFTAEHYRRFVGRMARIRLAAPVEGRRNITGLLKGYEDGCVVVEEQGAELRLPLHQVRKANLIPEDGPEG